MLMNVVAWILWLIIGVIIGLIAGATARNERRYSYDILAGILGAFIGGFLFNQLGFVGITDFHPWSLIAAPIGAIALIALYRYLDRRVIVRDNTRGVYTPETVARVQDRLEGRAMQEERVEATTDTPRNVPRVEDRAKVDDRPRDRRPVYLQRGFILASILAIPFLDAIIFRLRIPDISQSPPPFGVVESYSNEFGKLDYLVYQPASSDANTEMPLVMMLHGCTQDPYLLDAASGMREIADANGFMLVYPQQNASASPHRCWNWYDTLNQQRTTGEPALLMGIISEVRQNYPVDESRIYVTGISAGGAMTSILASCYPDVFAAAAVHSGMAYKASKSVIEAIIAPFFGSQTEPNVAGQAAYNCSSRANETIPVLVLHGTADTVVFPVNNGDTLEEFAQLNDLQDDGQDNDSVQAEPGNSQSQQVEGGYPYTIEDYASNGEMLMQSYVIDGLGHMWSGGTGIYPLSDPKSPNASQIFWDFMSDYQQEQAEAD
jgi:poly(hydroxyalkanoate) depolymerase family esterase